jgi:hypothetical protein
MSPQRRLAAALTGAALALGVAACSTDKSGASPAQTVETFMRAIGAKDPDTACAQVSTSGRPLAGTALDQCREGLQKVLAAVQDPGDLEKLKAAKVTGAEVTGDKATVKATQIIDVPDGYQNDIDLLRLSGRWYIDSKTDPAAGTGPTG